MEINHDPSIRFAHLPTPIEACRASKKPWAGRTAGQARRPDRAGLWRQQDPQTGIPGGRSPGRRSAIRSSPPGRCSPTTAARPPPRRPGSALTAFWCWSVSRLRRPAPTSCSTSFLEPKIIWTEKSRRDAVLQETFEQVQRAGTQTLPGPVWRFQSDRGAGICLCNGRIRRAGCQSRLDRLCLLLRRDAGRAGARRTPLRLSGQGARHQRGRAAGRLAGACGKPGLRDLRPARAAHRFHRRTRSWSTPTTAAPATAF